MDILGKIFGSESKVRIMRLFLFNPDTPFESAAVVERAKVTPQVARHVLRALRKIKLIKSKSFVASTERRLARNGRVKRRRRRAWGLLLNPSFQYLRPLRALLIESGLLRGDELVKKLGVAGKLKLLILSGVFIQHDDSRVDVLVVCDNVRRTALANAVRTIEAEIGKELVFAAFDTAEFKYRLNMYDKLVRDILDYPHRVLVDRLGLAS